MAACPGWGVAELTSFVRPLGAGGGRGRSVGQPAPEAQHTLHTVPHKTG